MNEHSLPKEQKKAIDLIDHIERLGFPNAHNISDIESHFKRLEILAPTFKDPAHQVSLNRLHKMVQEMKKTLEKKEDVLVATYTKFYANLVVFKENLIAA